MLATMVEALVRSYDHVVIDVGSAADIAVERFAPLAARAVLVAADPANPATRAARERLMMAGFADVTLMAGMPQAPPPEPSLAVTAIEGIAYGTRSNVAGMKQTIIRTGLETLYFSGMHHVMRPLVGGVGAILTLHHVRPPRPDAFQPNRLLEVTPEFLERLLRRLQARAHRRDLARRDASPATSAAISSAASSASPSTTATRI